jgi:hypothetical protein
VGARRPAASRGRPTVSDLRGSPEERSRRRESAPRDHDAPESDEDAADLGRLEAGLLGELERLAMPELGVLDGDSADRLVGRRAGEGEHARGARARPRGDEVARHRERIRMAEALERLADPQVRFCAPLRSRPELGEQCLRDQWMGEATPRPARGVEQTGASGPVERAREGWRRTALCLAHHRRLELHSDQRSGPQQLPSGLGQRARPPLDQHLDPLCQPLGDP